jgi:DNA-binding transcriptional MerR regulator
LPRRISVPVNAQGIPEKPYFKIGEAARICGVQPYVLRYWETEFRSLRPQKTQSQQRLYRRKDVELLLQIRHLLYEKRFTIAGARERLRELGRDESPASRPPRVVERETLRKLKQGIVDMLRLVQD